MTESGSPDGTDLIKTDSSGRMRTGPERRRMLLEEFDRSGLSGVQFARLVGINYQTFAGWRQRRARERVCQVPARTGGSPSVRLVEAVATVGPQELSVGRGVMVHLPDGARLELRDVRQVPLAVELLRALQTSSSPC